MSIHTEIISMPNSPADANTGPDGFLSRKGIPSTHIMHAQCTIRPGRGQGIVQYFNRIRIYCRFFFASVNYIKLCSVYCMCR